MTDAHWMDVDDAGEPVRPDQTGERAEIERRVREYGRSGFSTALTTIGAVLIAISVIVPTGLALTYRAEHGNPMDGSSSSTYQSERGVPPAADLVFGVIGAFLGLTLVALANVVTSTAATAFQAVRTAVLAETADDDVSDGRREPSR